MAVLIDAFEVPVGADERFTAGWAGSAAMTLHRALRDDVDFRFVAVAHAESLEAGPSDEFASHRGLYEVVHRDGAPDGHGGVVLINPFEVPDGADEKFVAAWDRARTALAGRRGYLGTQLHRSLGPADFRYVNVARWSSPLMFAQAIEQPEFRDAAGAMPFGSHPALYTIVRG